MKLIYSILSHWVTNAYFKQLESLYRNSKFHQIWIFDGLDVQKLPLVCLDFCIQKGEESNQRKIDLQSKMVGCWKKFFCLLGSLKKTKKQNGTNIWDSFVKVSYFSQCGHCAVQTLDHHLKKWLLWKIDCIKIFIDFCILSTKCDWSGQVGALKCIYPYLSGTH